MKKIRLATLNDLEAICKLYTSFFLVDLAQSKNTWKMKRKLW